MSDTNDAGWRPDPTGRHEQRYFDGTAFTDDVADGTTTGTDPMDAPATPPPAADATQAVPAGGVGNEPTGSFAAPPPGAAPPPAAGSPPEGAAPSGGYGPPGGAAPPPAPMEGDDSGPNWKVIGPIAAVVAVLVGGGVFLALNSGGDDGGDNGVSILADRNSGDDDPTPTTGDDDPTPTTADPGPDDPDPDPGGSVPSAGSDALDLADFGDDPQLDALAIACDVGDMQSCDDLFFQSPAGSAYEEYGRTCGDRLSGDAIGLCTDEFDGSAAPDTSSGGAYPQEFIDGFIEGCSAEASVAQCQCVVDAAQEQFTLDEFIDLSTSVGADGSVPPEFQPIIDGCR